jgi:hypothetical protein
VIVTTLRSARVPAGTAADRRLMAPLSEWQAAVVRLDGVDPVTTEVVRVRCAHHHDCHT